MRIVRWLLVPAFCLGVGGVAMAEHHVAKLSMAAARTKALEQVNGKVVHEELEHEKGRWIYSFEIRPQGETGKMVKEVNLDADTGAVVSIGTENE